MCKELMRKSILRLPIQFFAETTPSAEEIAAATAAAEEAATAAAAAKAAEDALKEPKTFTQAEINKMMATEKNQGRLAILKELGIEDAKTAKEGLEKYKAYVESQKTEEQKLKDESDADKKARLAAESKATLLEQKFEALNLGVIKDYVDDVIALAKVKVNDTKDFTTVVTEMKETYPIFFTDDGSSDKNKPNGTGRHVNPKRQPTGTEDIGKRLGSLAKATEVKSKFFQN